MTRWERKVKLRWPLSLRRLTSLGSLAEEREGRRWKEREGEQILSHLLCFACMGGRRREGRLVGRVLPPLEVLELVYTLLLPW